MYIFLILYFGDGDFDRGGHRELLSGKRLVLHLGSHQDRDIQPGLLRSGIESTNQQFTHIFVIASDFFPCLNVDRPRNKGQCITLDSQLCLPLKSSYTATMYLQAYLSLIEQNSEPRCRLRELYLG